MSTSKKAKVVMLPTNEKVINTKEYQLLLSASLFWTSKIEIERYTEGWFFLNNSSAPNSCAITIPNVELFKHQHLYIISDDEIKEGDWCYDKRPDENGDLVDIVYQVKNIEFELRTSTEKKIIATTDSSLWRPSHKYASDVILLPQPSQQFIEKFIEEYNKGNMITDVLVEYELKITHDGRINNNTKMWEELKINPKDNTITIKKVKDYYTREEVVKLLVDCCGEVSCEDGKLLGKNPEELYKWIEENL